MPINYDDADGKLAFSIKVDNQEKAITNTLDVHEMLKALNKNSTVTLKEGEENKVGSKYLITEDRSLKTREYEVMSIGDSFVHALRLNVIDNSKKKAYVLCMFKDPKKDDAIRILFTNQNPNFYCIDLLFCPFSCPVPIYRAMKRQGEVDKIHENLVGYLNHHTPTVQVAEIPVAQSV